MSTALEFRRVERLSSIVKNVKLETRSMRLELAARLEAVAQHHRQLAEHECDVCSSSRPGETYDARHGAWVLTNCGCRP